MQAYNRRERESKKRQKQRKLDGNEKENGEGRKSKLTLEKLDKNLEGGNEKEKK
jgi:hypothetical protein